MDFNTTQELIEEFRQGRMVILVDDEGRENEGDLIMPASLVTADSINFMARYGRGLICMPITRERCEQLGLWLMVSDNRESQKTKFTVSIDAAHGVTTGISASDRAVTIQAAVSADARPADFVQPGHIFPLVSEPGGVLARAGHTEAGCDLARLAGLEPAAVLVEILNEDGTMARRPDLEQVAQTHGLKIGTIADLIHYRVLNEKTVHRVSECLLPTRHGEFQLVAFQESTTSAVVSREGNGVVLILRHHEDDTELIHRIHSYQLEDAGEPLARKEPADDLRTYGVGAQILMDLGVRKMRILSAPKHIPGISGFGLEVVEYVN
jgi:3,4-dihydroxy 2-butanone 4-phosphate synthase/GTP cyclohydrolase II